MSAPKVNKAGHAAESTGQALDMNEYTGQAVEAPAPRSSTGPAHAPSASTTGAASSSGSVWSLSPLAPAKLLASLPPGFLAGHAADTLDSSESEHPEEVVAVRAKVRS